MISEIANSLFLTYLASEYILSSPSAASSSSKSLSTSRTLKSANANIYENHFKKASLEKDNCVVLGFLLSMVGIANLLDHHYYLSVVWESATQLFPNIPSYYIQIPAKLFTAATSYVLALYVDIHRMRKSDNSRRSKHRIKKIPFRTVFLPRVGWAFLKILPAYPFLAVLISFGFLFVVDLWDFVFHLPLDWLNNPIYYGTLYGPFAYTYVYVKREIVHRNNDECTGTDGGESTTESSFV